MSDRRLPRRVVWIVLAAVLLWLPQYVEGFWLQTGLFAMSAAIGAIGLTLLVGVTGQLSLAHAFFIAIGAYGYCYLSGKSGGTGGAITAPDGLGWPPWLAVIGAVVLAGAAGALFSPIAGRLKGIYLGLASIGLVFIGQHILQNATPITGGFSGRDATPFSVAGFHFADAQSRQLLGLRGPLRPARAAVVPGPAPGGSWPRGTRAICCVPGRAGRWRPSATARSPPRSWASTCRCTERRPSP